MSLASAFQLRLALALVLLNSKPPSLSLHEYLDRLRSEVRRRTGKDTQHVANEIQSDKWEKSDWMRRSLERSAEGDQGKDWTDLGYLPHPVSHDGNMPFPSHQTGDTLLSTALALPEGSTLPPSNPLDTTPQVALPAPPPLPASAPALSPSGLLSLVHTVRQQLSLPSDGDTQADVDHPSPSKTAATFPSLVPLLKWVAEQAAASSRDSGLATEAGKAGLERRAEKERAAGEVEHMGREEVEKAVSSLLVDLLPSILPDLACLPSFASILFQFASTCPRTVVEWLLPSCLSQLAQSFTYLCDGDSAKEGEVESLLSLIHLIFSAFPPDLFSHVLPIPAEYLGREVDDLTLALTSPAADAVLEQHEELEQRLLGVMEGCWVLREGLRNPTVGEGV
ncbi:hypothetical protein JCM11641_000849 [Rhodosporidiobolus odoratus]